MPAKWGKERKVLFDFPGRSFVPGAVPAIRMMTRPFFFLKGLFFYLNSGVGHNLFG